ncbi:MAG TPA: penicillin-binding protein [Desulfotomaculum sp.]|nr:penicillin-binding protein [Desulfotomaculum sp.]
MARNIKIFLVLLVIVLAVEFAGLFIYTYTVVSQPVTYTDLDRNSFIYDREGRQMADLQGKASRVPVSLDRVPDQVRNAFIAIEDERYFNHSGVDPRAIARAFFGNIREGEIVQGGSTITQQVVKMHFLTPEKTYARKYREAILSLQFENTHSKNEILEIYLNDIYLGEGAYGVQAASQKYFGKDVGDLSLAEGALLAGITQAPSRLDPFTNPSGSLDRRNTVLGKMVELGMTDSASALTAREAPLGLRDRRPPGEALASYYVDHVIDEAVRLVGNDAVFGGGIKITTAFEPGVQSEVERVLAKEKFQDELVQCGLVLLNSNTGEIISMVGGRSYEAARGFNRATQLKRQPGSAMKPLAVYGPAFELGYRKDTIVEDTPRSWNGYAPKNYDGGSWGSITAQKAVQWSRNIAAVWLLDRIGIDRGYEFASRLGIGLDKDDRHLALALGGLTRGVSPLEMAGAYACFANGGNYSPPHAVTLIEDSAGKVLYEAPGPVSVMKESTASMMTDVLKSVVRSGTGRPAAVRGFEVAGKTGTTELPGDGRHRGAGGNKDAWFVGYVDQYTGALWVGYDERDMDGRHYLRKGGDMAAGIFGRVLASVLEESGRSPESKR